MDKEIKKIGEVEAEKEEKSLTPQIVAPLVTPDEAKKAWRKYQDVCKAILDKNDYVTIETHEFRKKSGWRKLARVFNISDEIVRSEVEQKSDAEVVYRFWVKAIAPNDRSVVRCGSCSSLEFLSDTDVKTLIEHKDQSLKQLRTISKHLYHDAEAKAQTRATNRAIADLIGAGEVSAEEMESGKGEAFNIPREKQMDLRPSPGEEPATPRQLDLIRNMVRERSGGIDILEKYLGGEQRRVIDQMGKHEAMKLIDELKELPKDETGGLEGF
jgi:hypothetical protein